MYKRFKRIGGISAVRPQKVNKLVLRYFSSALCYQILEQKYSLTEQDAQQIAAEPDDIVYTKMILAVTQGRNFNDGEVPDAGQEPLEDMLPEESELGETNFVNSPL